MPRAAGSSRTGDFLYSPSEHLVDLLFELHRVMYRFVDDLLAGEFDERCQRIRVLPEDDHNEPGGRKEVAHGCSIGYAGVAVGKCDAETAVPFFFNNLLDALFQDLR